MNDHRACALRIGLAGLLLGACAWAPAALGFSATALASVHLRAGPSVEYPVVSLLPAGAVVEVFGCEQNYGWCDAQIGPDRGWVDAAYLQAQSAGAQVIVADSGVMLGIPIVTFAFGSYWDRYYRGRPWYARRPYYYGYWNRYPHGRPPPPPHRPIMRPPVRPPPMARPPRPRPPAARPPPPGTRPPGNGRPGADRPGSGRPSGDRPRPGDRSAPPDTRPAGPGQ